MQSKQQTEEEDYSDQNDIDIQQANFQVQTKVEVLDPLNERDDKSIVDIAEDLSPNISSIRGIYDKNALVRRFTILKRNLKEMKLSLESVENNLTKDLNFEYKAAVNKLYNDFYKAFDEIYKNLSVNYSGHISSSKSHKITEALRVDEINDLIKSGISSLKDSLFECLNKNQTKVTSLHIDLLRVFKLAKMFRDPQALSQFLIVKESHMLVGIFEKNSNIPLHDLIITDTKKISERILFTQLLKIPIDFNYYKNEIETITESVIPFISFSEQITFIDTLLSKNKLAIKERLSKIFKETLPVGYPLSKDSAGFKFQIEENLEKIKHGLFEAECVASNFSLQINSSITDEVNDELLKMIDMITTLTETLSEDLDSLIEKLERMEDIELKNFSDLLEESIEKMKNAAKKNKSGATVKNQIIQFFNSICDFLKKEGFEVNIDFNKSNQILSESFMDISQSQILTK